MNPVKTRPFYPLILLILLLGAGLRWHQASADVRFHSDEALYATYGRNAAVFGHWMMQGSLDKPPLSLYANAISQHFFAARLTPDNVIDVPLRAGEFAAKIPNVFAGLILIALIYALSVKIYANARAGLLTALIVAVSPYAIAYSASAFTDMLMVMLALSAWLAAAYGRAGWAGALLALSMWAKPQGLVFAPFVIFHLRWRTTDLILPFCSVLVSLFLWDTLRPETSLFTLGRVNIHQDTVAMPPDTWLNRLDLWIRYSQDLFGVPLLTLIIGILSVLGTWLYGQQPEMRGLMGLWCIGFTVIHLFLPIPIFNRYLLPLVPVMALMIVIVPRYLQALVYILPPLILILGLLGHHNPRGDVFRPTQEDAFLHVSAWLNERPLGAIVYDHWLGWEMGYYMGAWTDKRHVYYPDALIFAKDALLNPDVAPRYFLTPTTVEYEAWLNAIQQKGFAVRLAYTCAEIAIYELIHPTLAEEAALGVESSCPAG